MKMSMIIAIVADETTDAVIDAARAGGATGATVINSARGEGLKPGHSFFGLEIGARRDVLLFLVLEPRARDILERIRDAARMDAGHGSGIALQLAIEDAVGLTTQIPTLLQEWEKTQ